MSAGTLSERKLLFLIGSVQFINVLDFMMVMPLGPDFARALGIPAARIGVVGGVYTAAAAVAGIVGALFLDRFDRRKALGWALGGLVLGTALGGFAWSFPSLVAARVIAGAFGGPATALALAIVADEVPIERRGRAMGAVMSAFSVASVLGVPFGLELARIGNWQTPFFAVAALGALVTGLAIALLPPFTLHLQARGVREAGFRDLLRKPTVLMALSTTALAMLGNFALIPNISAYVQINLGYPRERLGLLYLVGGTCSFLTLRLAGKLADHAGPARAGLLGSLLFAGALAVGFIHPLAALPVLAIFVAFMVTSSFRFVPMQALSSRVPEPAERARFMSLQSCVQHLASALGAILASQLLTTRPDGGLEGMPVVASFTAVLALCVPLLMFTVEARVRRRELTAQAVAPARPSIVEPIPSSAP
jgi:predicted MFS family arabinose efflux permease